MTSGFVPSAEASLLYTNRYFFRLVISLLTFPTSVHGQSIYVHICCLCHFSKFYTVGDIHHVQKEAAIPHFSRGCIIVYIYILKKRKNCFRLDLRKFPLQSFF